MKIGAVPICPWKIRISLLQVPDEVVASTLVTLHSSRNALDSESEKAGWTSKRYIDKLGPSWGRDREEEAREAGSSGRSQTRS